MPVALGVIYRLPAAGYSERFYEHHPTRFERSRSVADYLAGPSPWVVD